MQIEFDLPDTNSIAQALNLFLGDDHKLPKKWISALKNLFHGSSFSEIEREITNVRRRSVVNTGQLVDELPSLIQRRIHGASKDSKKEVAQILTEAGLSQRAINEITGLSRDTIRKVAPREKV